MLVIGGGFQRIGLPTDRWRNSGIENRIVRQRGQRGWPCRLRRRRRECLLLVRATTPGRDDQKDERRCPKFDGGSRSSGVHSPRKRRILLLRASRGGGLLEAVRAAELFSELIHPAGGVDELLFAGEERV